MGSQHDDTSIEAIFAQHAERTALRQRSGPEVTDMSFGELWDRASALAAALGETVSAGDRIAVLGTATADAVTLDLAAWILGAVSVPLQASAPVGTLQRIVEETTPVWIAATAEQAATARAVAEASGDGIRTMLLDTGTGTGTALTLDALVARGAGLPGASPWHPAPGDDPLALLLYTSGSTGTPKGAMYTRSMVERMWHAMRTYPAMGPDASTPAHDGSDDAADAIVGYAYLPMSHLTNVGADVLGLVITMLPTKGPDAY
ncbi:AMP-binding protein, partial [Clavibacter michiganensis]